MLNWVLIISITMVSTSMLLFSSAYIAILPQASQYYQKSISHILLLSNSFNILYLIATPFIFPILKKRFCLLVNASVILTGIGCVGRYFCTTDYNLALLMSSLVAIGHISIITAPYGLLDLFSEKQKGYAASIPLFVPTLGVNFSILYGMQFVASDAQQTQAFTKYSQIDKLNFINAIVGASSCMLTLICMIKLKDKIKLLNQHNSTSESQGNSLFKSVRQQFKGGKSFFIMMISWGSILGFNWTYGGMFGVIFAGSKLTHKEIALIGLFANLSSIFFSNFGSWMSKYFNFKAKTVIFALNMVGFLATLFLQASSAFESGLAFNKYTLILAIIILRAGFSSYVPLAMLELSHCGPSILISAIFFYVANASNILGNYIIDMLSNSISLAVLSFLIWICIFAVQKSSHNLPQVQSQEVIENTCHLEQKNSQLQESIQYQNQKPIENESESEVKINV